MDRLESLSYTPPMSLRKNQDRVDAQALRESVERLRQEGLLELHEDGELLAELAEMHCEVRDESTGVFFHAWSEERNLTRRVLQIATESADSIMLEVQRFGRAKPGKLEICAAASRTQQRLTRERFKARLRRLLAEQFPDEQSEGLTSAPDLEHSISGSYVRGVMKRGQRIWALLAASPTENAGTLDSILTFGLLWLDWTREHADRSVVEGLRVILPGGAAALTAHRLAALADWVNIEIYTLSETLERLRKVDSADAGNLETWLSPHREALAAKAAAQSAIQRITALAPDAIDVMVRAAPSGTAREVAFHFHGLEFARWLNGKLECLDTNSAELSQWKELSGPDSGLLERAVRTLQSHRSCDAADRQHPLYRMAAERWMESSVLKDITRIDAQLDSEFCYPQVPALAPPSASHALGAGRGVLDILTMTRSGRLAVIELKADENMHLVLQGADYWLRARWHQCQGDFQRYGYFAGREIQDLPPLLFLVAPGLRFHPATDVLLKYLSKEIEVQRVGLNEDWRRELKVVFRQ